MTKRVEIRRREYYDSVRLMQVSEQVRRQMAVEETILMMATDNNKRLLDVAGLLTDDAQDADPDDLLIAIVAENEEAVGRAMERALELLTRRAGAAVEQVHRSLGAALATMPDATLALISVPGQYAAAEARRALERGLHVMLFSDNVDLEDEIALKRLAAERDRLMMGPDCGTAIINGTCLGFANVVRPGAIGIVGASGTGIQEISVLIDRAGLGISHAIGTGGRDLSRDVGGTMMLMGLDLLASDDSTQVIVLTSKPPNEQISRRVLSRAALCPKPVVVNFLGGDPAFVTEANLTSAATLEEAAWIAVRLVRETAGTSLRLQEMDAALEQSISREASELAIGQRYLRGLYAGGTLCYEAMLILADTIPDLYSNIPLRPELGLQDPWQSRQHTFVDLGEDVFTQGRAHPMIDPTLRVQRLIQEASDPEVAVILFDVVLGLGSHANPAEPMSEAVSQAKVQAKLAGRHLAVVAYVCGTEEDPQHRSTQERSLREAGILVATSNAQAVRIAAEILRTSGGNSSENRRLNGG